MNSRKPAKRRSRAVEQRNGTLTDRAYRELEEMIVTLRLLPGTVLSEQALSVRLKIGRTPIREALQRLARDGLVVIMEGNIAERLERAKTLRDVDGLK